MIDQDKARQIAQRALDEADTREPMRLSPSVIDSAAHWVIPFNTVKYYETGDIMLANVGAGPIAVSKDDGSFRFLHGATPFEEQL